MFNNADCLLGELYSINCSQDKNSVSSCRLPSEGDFPASHGPQWNTISPCTLTSLGIVSQHSLFCICIYLISIMSGFGAIFSVINIFVFCFPQEKRDTGSGCRMSRSRLISIEHVIMECASTYRSWNWMKKVLKIEQKGETLIWKQTKVKYFRDKLQAKIWWHVVF